MAMWIMGCTSLSKPERTVNKLIIQNFTGVDMEDVSLRVPETSAVIGYSTILRDREFSVAFPETENKEHAAYLHWFQGKQEFSRRLRSRHEINLDMQPGVSFTIVVDVYSGGSLEINLQ
jgi:hypothetical protein